MNKPSRDFTEETSAKPGPKLGLGITRGRHPLSNVYNNLRCWSYKAAIYDSVPGPIADLLEDVHDEGERYKLHSAYVRGVRHTIERISHV